MYMHILGVCKACNNKNNIYPRTWFTRSHLPFSGGRHDLGILGVIYSCLVCDLGSLFPFVFWIHCMVILQGHDKVLVYAHLVIFDGLSSQVFLSCAGCVLMDLWDYFIQFFKRSSYVYAYIWCVKRGYCVCIYQVCNAWYVCVYNTCMVLFYTRCM